MERSLTSWLALAGAVPFIAAALALPFGLEPLAPWASMREMVQSYGLLIVSFMAGVHWGQHLSGHRLPANLLLTSNGVTLAAWFAYLLLPGALFLLVLAGLFALLYLLDRQLAGRSAISPGYLRMRGVVTAIVCLSLAVAGFA